MNAAKRAILAAVTNTETRAGLRTFPGAYFQVALETVDDPEDLTAVLWRIIELYNDAVEQMVRRNDAFEAQAAEIRRHGLHLIDEHLPASPAAPDTQQKGSTP
jgi:hypothetical protein